MASSHLSLEQRYRQLRDSGSPGWYPAGVHEERLQFWTEAIAALSLAPGKALELGCGSGDVSLLLAQQGWDVVGVDVSATAIEWAEAKARERELAASFLSADLGAFSLPDALEAHRGKCELVIDADCLHYVIGESRKNFLRHAKAMCARRGMFLSRTIIGEPSREFWEMLNYDPSTKVSYHGKTPMTYNVPLTELREELREAGFSVAEERRVTAESYDTSETWFFVCLPAQSDRRSRVISPSYENQTSGSIRWTRDARVAAARIAGVSASLRLGL